MLEAYFDRCDLCFQRFQEAMDHFFDAGLTEAFAKAVDQVNRAEGDADDQRREIEYLLYGRALLPESRGDLLGLIETYDKLPNIVETIVFALSCQQFEIPEVWQERFQSLVSINLESLVLARKAVDSLLANPKSTLHITKEIEHKESESDRYERSLMTDVFSSEHDLAVKLLLKDLILLMGAISDRAERVADRIAITAIKRQV